MESNPIDSWDLKNYKVYKNNQNDFLVSEGKKIILFKYFFMLQNLDYIYDYKVFGVKSDFEKILFSNETCEISISSNENPLKFTFCQQIRSRRKRYSIPESGIVLEEWEIFPGNEKPFSRIFNVFLLNDEPGIYNLFKETDCHINFKL